ncbi:MAG: hypothetical protein KDI66_15090 [Xanthomonadales bacterium]|nr:hypothetical protein [Xanthomonadales bacterium]
MTADELFRWLTLENLSLTGMQAALHGNEARTTECNAHVEFQLTPSAVEGTVPPQFALQTRLTCVGTPVRGVPGTKLFDLEIRAVALYRQIGGESLNATDFATHHTVLARQLFPVLSIRAQTLLQDLGLHNIRLPMDLPQQLNQNPPTAGPVVLN